MTVLVLDTDPGVDDMLALLLLLSANPDKAELRKITLTYGNCSLQDTLKNTLSLFNVLKHENGWRKQNNLPSFTKQAPTIHLGASGPLSVADPNAVDATDVHGSDGLAGIHTSNPEFDAPEEWFNFFEEDRARNSVDLGFKASSQPAYLAILDLLESEPENTVTIVAVGPLTNLALAAKHDLKTFSRVKEVLSMGAALQRPGNITPLAEFNIHSDPIAAAQIYSLTSAIPSFTMPARNPLAVPSEISPLRLIIFALDITTEHNMQKSEVEEEIDDVLRRYPDSILTKWIQVWLTRSFVNYGKLIGVGPDNAVLNLHDPLTAAYALSDASADWQLQWQDVRVESEGQWARGLTVVDQRGRVKQENNPHDLGNWLSKNRGNRVGVVVNTPIKASFSNWLLKNIIKL